MYTGNPAEAKVSYVTIAAPLHVLLLFNTLIARGRRTPSPRNYLLHFTVWQLAVQSLQERRTVQDSGLSPSLLLPY